MALLFLGKKAKHYFENLKKRYQKKKNNLKKADRSGTSTAIVGKARKYFEPYLFFTWFDAYTRQRSSKSNIMCDNDSDSMVESYDKIDADDDGGGSSIDDTSDTESVSSDQIEIISKPACFIKPNSPVEIGMNLEEIAIKAYLVPLEPTFYVE